MKKIVCIRCKSKTQLRFKEVKFRDDSVHIRVNCRGCGKHIQYVKREDVPINQPIIWLSNDIENPVKPLF